MNTCPCCSGKLLRHTRHGKVYLFCTHCWQEMPDLLVEQSTPREPEHPVPRVSDDLLLQRSLESAILAHS